MENDKQRDEFEKFCGVYDGAVFCVDKRKYIAQYHGEVAYKAATDQNTLFSGWKAAQAAQQQEIDRLNAQLYGSVTIVKEKFYPADKEMVEQLRAENDRLNAKVAELREALEQIGDGSAKDKDGTPKVVNPDRWPFNIVKKALASTDTTWLDRKIAEAKREALEEAIAACETVGLTVITTLDQVRMVRKTIVEELRRMADLKG